MPTSETLIFMQRDFEEPRGLDKYNTLQHGLDRMREELDEAQAELDANKFLDMAMEIVDVQIFAHSVLSKLCEIMGLEPSIMDRMIEDKMLANHQKYNLDHFNLVGQTIGGSEFTTQDAIRRVRHFHNNELPKGNDYV